MVYLLRRWPQPWVRRVLTLAIWAMLFAISVEVGANELLVSSLGKLGAETLLITLLTTQCCSVSTLQVSLLVQGRNVADWLAVSFGRKQHSSKKLLTTKL